MTPAVASAYRYRPWLEGLHAGADGREPRLGEMRPRLAVASHIDMNERDAGSIDEPAKSAREIAPRSRRERGKKVVQGDRPVAMARHVSAKSISKDVIPHPAREHPEDARSLEGGARFLRSRAREPSRRENPAPRRATVPAANDRSAERRMRGGEAAIMATRVCHARRAPSRDVASPRPEHPDDERLHL